MYRLKKPYDNGTTHIVFSPLEFVERLASLVPRPRVNLSRYHGLFAPHAKHRSLITPKPPTTEILATLSEPDKDNPPSKYRITWARLLKRVFGIDIETCIKCRGKIKVMAAILDPKVIVKILKHLGLSFNSPEFLPARGPPLFAETFPDQFLPTTT